MLRLLLRVKLQWATSPAPEGEGLSWIHPVSLVTDLVTVNVQGAPMIWSKAT